MTPRAIELWRNIEQAKAEAEYENWSWQSQEALRRAYRMAEEEFGMPWWVIENKMESYAQTLLAEAA